MADGEWTRGTWWNCSVSISEGGGRGQDLGGVSQEGGVRVGVATGTGLVQGGEYSGHTLQ